MHNSNILRSASDIRLSHLAMLSGIMRQTLTARAKIMFDKKDIKRTPGNHILFNTDQAKKLIEDKFCFKPGKIIWVGDRKGGVGKSTLSYFLSMALCHMGIKTCGIDLDQQYDLTKQFLKKGTKTSVFTDIIEDEDDPAKKINDIIIPIWPTFDLIPSSPKNGNIQQIISSQKPKHLENWINKICINYLRNNYDVIIIDTPAMPNTLLSAFYLSLNEYDSILVPAEPDDYSDDGIAYICKDIQRIRNEYKKTENMPKISVVINKIRQNTTAHLDDLNTIKVNHGDLLVEKMIPNKAQIHELRVAKTPFNEIEDPKEFYEIMNFLLQELKIISEK